MNVGMVQGYPSLSRKGREGEKEKKREKDLWGRVPYSNLAAWCQREAENILKGH